MMDEQNGYLQDEVGNRSTGRAMAWLCVFAGIGVVYTGLFLPSDHAILAFKGGCGLVAMGFVFYSGGKGLDQIRAIWGGGE